MSILGKKTPNQSVHVVPNYRLDHVLHLCLQIILQIGHAQQFGIEYLPTSNPELIGENLLTEVGGAEGAGSADGADGGAGGGGGVEEDGRPLDESGMQIPTSGGAGIGPISHTGDDARIAGGARPAIDGSGRDAAAVQAGPLHTGEGARK